MQTHMILFVGSMQNSGVDLNTQENDNHAGRDPVNVFPYACSDLSSRKNNTSKKKLFSAACVNQLYYIQLQ